MKIMTYAAEIKSLMAGMSVSETAYSGGTYAARSPITGEVLAQIPTATASQTTDAIAQAHAAFKIWRVKPAPLRGELV